MCKGKKTGKKKKLTSVIYFQFLNDDLATTPLIVQNRFAFQFLHKKTAGESRKHKKNVGLLPRCSAHSFRSMRSLQCRGTVTDMQETQHRHCWRHWYVLCAFCFEGATTMVREKSGREQQWPEKTTMNNQQTLSQFFLFFLYIIYTTFVTDPNFRASKLKVFHCHGPSNSRSFFEFSKILGSFFLGWSL